MDRVAYIIGRILQMIPTVVVVTVLVFLMVHLIPGDPATIMLGVRATTERIAVLSEHLGLDKPLYVQFVLFVRNALQGDFGNSLVNRIPVTELIGRRLPLTLFLAAYAATLSILCTIPLSLIAALNRDKAVDQVIRGASVAILATPGFWIGILLLIVFGTKLRWFPVGGTGKTFVEQLRYLFLPALTLSLHLTAVLTRNFRDGIISTLIADHVTFARAKGLRDQTVLSKHVLRNAMVSTVTILGLYLSWLVGGSVIIETVFALPGVGFTMIQAIQGRDYPVVQALTLTFGILVSIVYLVNDIIYSFLDPRVSL